MQRHMVYRPNGARLRELRQERGLMLRDVEAAASIDKRTIVEYEDGERTEKFQYNQLRRLADFYGVTFDSLLQPISPSRATADGGA